MPPAALLLPLLASGATAQPTGEGGFAPGWNGLASAPPMAWRSWNAFQYCIRAGLPGDNSSCAMAGPPGKPFLPMSCEASTGRLCGSIAAAMERITARNISLDGRLVSLADVGYDTVGVDEGWEACGEGVGGGQHDAQGNPLANLKRFPDLRALVAFGHRRGLKVGWYLNGCGCPEILQQFGGKVSPAQLERMYEGDVRTLSALGFDSVKLDGCGSLRNNTRFAALMRQTGKAFEVENCHWGAMQSIGCHPGDDGSACPTASWCPFTTFRTSGDIGAGSDSWFRNLQTVLPYTKRHAPLSVPSCWAYPE